MTYLKLNKIMDTNIERLLKIGLYAMSKSSEEERWFPGHIGASLITIALFIEENSLNSEVEKVIISKADEIIDLNLIRYLDISSDIKQSIKPIEDAIAVNVENFSADGHGIIYGSLALKAIDILDINISSDIIQGINKLILLAQNDNVGRYWTVENYKTLNIEHSQLNHFKDVYEAADYCLNHQENVLNNEVINDKTYYFSGSRLHEVTHSNALMLLDKLGYSNLAKTGLRGLEKQIYFNKKQPTELRPEKNHQVFNPLEVEFWKYPIKDYHHYKLAYAVFNLFNILKVKNTDQILKAISSHWKIINV